MSKRCALGSESAAYRDEVGGCVPIFATVQMDADPLSTARIQYPSWAQDENGFQLKPIVQQERTG